MKKMITTGITALAIAIGLGATAEISAADANTKLFVRYETSDSCTVYLNYPKPGVKANETFTVPRGKQIIWRYNVDKTWALISYPTRARKEFPWWGFTKRDCLGKSVKQKNYPAGVSVPDRILEGRSRKAAGDYRSVTFNVPPAPVVAHHKKVTRNATLRDDVNFVVGNVPSGWHVDVTNRTRSDGHWVEVYVPNAKRWGYIERAALS